MSKISSFLKSGVIATTMLLSACATTQSHSDVNDPLEGYNRVMHAFNDTVDENVLKPVSKGYDTVMPTPVRHGVNNFFNNLNDITVIINDILQFKFMQAFEDTSRFAINSTIGLAGLMDVATDMGYKKNDEDFGQTLGKWGAGTGPYLVLPFIGPNNARDTIGLIGDYYSDPVTYVKGPDARNPMVATRIVDDRADLLKAEKVLDEAAIDEYSYIRDAYLQRRQSLVHDGDAPEEFDVFSD